MYETRISVLLCKGKYLRDSSVQTQNLFSRHSILSFAACEGEFL